MTHPGNPTNAYTVPSVSITTARTGASAKANALGMRAMQERIYAKRGEQYLLIKSPPERSIGGSEAEVRNSGKPALRAKMPMQRVGRAREAGETQGFMKVLVEAESRRLLGAAILGMNGDEVIHALLDMMAAGLPVDTISRTMHIHPTVSELVPTLLQQLKPLA